MKTIVTYVQGVRLKLISQWSNSVDEASTASIPDYNFTKNMNGKGKAGNEEEGDQNRCQWCGQSHPNVGCPSVSLSVVSQRLSDILIFWQFQIDCPLGTCCEYTDIFPFSPLLFIVSITFLISFRSYYLNHAIWKLRIYSYVFPIEMPFI